MGEPFTVHCRLVVLFFFLAAAVGASSQSAAQGNKHDGTTSEALVPASVDRANELEPSAVTLPSPRRLRLDGIGQANGGLTTKALRAPASINKQGHD